MTPSTSRSPYFDLAASIVNAQAAVIRATATQEDGPDCDCPSAPAAHLSTCFHAKEALPTGNLSIPLNDVSDEAREAQAEYDQRWYR